MHWMARREIDEISLWRSLAAAAETWEREREAFSVNTESKNKPTWQQDEMSLKFFSSTTVLLSGLMRFTSKRPTCDMQTWIFVTYADKKAITCSSCLQIMQIWLEAKRRKQQCWVSQNNNSSYSESRSVTDINTLARTQNQGQQVCATNDFSHNWLLHRVSYWALCSSF